MVNPRLYDSRKVAKKNEISHKKMIKGIRAIEQEYPGYGVIYLNKGNHYMIDNQGVVLIKIKFNKFR